MKITRSSAVALTAGAALALTGCGNAPSSPEASPVPPSVAAPETSSQVSPEHNQADITFAQGMVPHHQQAIDMADLAGERAASPQVKDLATKIEQAQDPEIEQLKDMLEAWGAPAPADPDSSAPGMDHGGGGAMPDSGTPGMMTDQQMQQLEQANGAAFDKMFLQMMINHHRGAIQMAQTEVAQGQNPEAKALARKIIADQRAEITTMESLVK